MSHINFQSLEFYTTEWKWSWVCLKCYRYLLNTFRMNGWIVDTALSAWCMWPACWSSKTHNWGRNGGGKGAGTIAQCINPPLGMPAAFVRSVAFLATNSSNPAPSWWVREGSKWCSMFLGPCHQWGRWPMNFQTPGFILVQPRLLQACEKWVNTWSKSLCLSFSLCHSAFKIKQEIS